MPNINPGFRPAYFNNPIHPKGTRTQGMESQLREQSTLSDQEYQSRFGVSREEFFQGPPTLNPVSSFVQSPPPNNVTSDLDRFARLRQRMGFG